MSMQVCVISQKNFDYNENGGKKTFSYKSKASICEDDMIVVPITKRMEFITSIQVCLIS